MSFSERVKRNNGTYTTVVADNEADLKEAVKLAKQESVEQKFDINDPVEEGHDLVVVNPDGSTELSNQVPEDALNFVPEANQEFAKQAEGVTGSTYNSPAAKAAAEAKAKEARGETTDESKSTKSSK